MKFCMQSQSHVLIKLFIVFHYDKDFQFGRIWSICQIFLCETRLLRNGVVCLYESLKSRTDSAGILEKTGTYWKPILDTFKIQSDLEILKFQKSSLLRFPYMLWKFFWKAIIKVDIAYLPVFLHLDYKYPQLAKKLTVGNGQTGTEGECES